jgi:small conductance mechanosensitive channel
MEILRNFYEFIGPILPGAVVLVGTIFILLAIRYLLERRLSVAAGRQFKRQIITMLISFAGLLAVILLLPVSENTRGQFLSLIGILLSAAIALSATTFVGNIMAGLMLSAVGSFRIGDFIRVGDHFGRVSERGLFHTEIQTEDRDLTTMPNLYLVTNPVKVIRSTGTVISTEVSLGYNIPRKKIEAALLTAAAAADLKDPFVYVMELGDFSVKYRVAGLLTEVKHTISIRSGLRAMVLDHLHKAGIEIVSPTFMNTRAISETGKFIPKADSEETAEDSAEKPLHPESLVFDKAEEAESIEKLRDRLEKIKEEIKNTDQQISETQDENRKNRLKESKERLEKNLETITDYIKRKEEKQ